MAKPHETQDRTTWQGQPLVMELLAELHEIDAKARVELRFYEILACVSHIESQYQYESSSLSNPIKMKKGEAVCYQDSLCGC